MRWFGRGRRGRHWAVENARTHLKGYLEDDGAAPRIANEKRALERLADDQVKVYGMRRVHIQQRRPAHSAAPLPLMMMIFVFLEKERCVRLPSWLRRHALRWRVRHAASTSSAPSKIHTCRSAAGLMSLLRVFSSTAPLVRTIIPGAQLTVGLGAQGDAREGDKCAADCVGACPQQGALDASSILTVPLCSLCRVCLSLFSLSSLVSRSHALSRFLSLSLALSRSLSLSPSPPSLCLSLASACAL